MKETTRATWEIMAFIQKAKGAELLADMLDVSVTQVRRYSRNPKMNFADPASPNPLDKTLDIIEELSDLEREDMILSFLNMIACRHGFYVSKDVPVKPDKKTLELEILDDHPILVEWHEAMLNKEPLHVIRTGLEKVNNEKMQTYIKYTERLR